ncbi:CsbD family protein [Aureimonas fodinaquatilis]|uniref:CsbD family protein n=1 Tax=Aureimonas fodinaquatilis TaxID=2565783 RepID=A0A5B0E356_9HYPH|nr:CsbD family protein [Aureimonas fodinaquatilis]KAA0971859.1 CsbD family protein [Aureimonas fodinaquatilis]
MDKDRIEGAAKEFGGKVQGAVGDAVGSPGNSAEGRVREAEGTAQNLYGQGKDAVRDAAGEASRYASDVYENAGAYAHEGSRAVRQSVQERPISALLIAGIIGFALGLSLRNRD